MDAPPRSPSSSLPQAVNPMAVATIRLAAKRNLALILNIIFKFHIIGRNTSPNSGIKSLE
jgi:hypothetical protein